MSKRTREPNADGREESRKLLVWTHRLTYQHTSHHAASHTPHGSARDGSARDGSTRGSQRGLVGSGLCVDWGSLGMCCFVVAVWFSQWGDGPDESRRVRGSNDLLFKGFRNMRLNLKRSVRVGRFEYKSLAHAVPLPVSAPGRPRAPVGVARRHTTAHRIRIQESKVKRLLGSRPLASRTEN